MLEMEFDRTELVGLVVRLREELRRNRSRPAWVQAAAERGLVAGCVVCGRRVSGALLRRAETR